MRHLPFYGRWFRFMMFYPGSGSTSSTPASTPTSTTATVWRSTRPTRRAAQFVGVDRAVARRVDPDLLDKVIPDYPAIAKRILQDNGSWLACLKKPNVELVRTASNASWPTGSSPSTARTMRPT